MSRGVKKCILCLWIVSFLPFIKCNLLNIQDVKLQEEKDISSDRFQVKPDISSRTSGSGFQRLFGKIYNREIFIRVPTERPPMPDYNTLTMDLAHGVFHRAQDAIETFVNHAGPLFNLGRTGLRPSVMADYAKLLLAGVGELYNTTVKIAPYPFGIGNDKITMTVLPPPAYDKYKFIPVRLAIETTSGLKKTWNRLKANLCPYIADLKKEETEILIMCSDSSRKVETCLRRASKV